MPSPPYSAAPAFAPPCDFEGKSLRLPSAGVIKECNWGEDEAVKDSRGTSAGVPKEFLEVILLLRAARCGDILERFRATASATALKNGAEMKIRRHQYRGERTCDERDFAAFCLSSFCARGRGEKATLQLRKTLAWTGVVWNRQCQLLPRAGERSVPELEDGVNGTRRMWRATCDW